MRSPPGISLYVLASYVQCVRHEVGGVNMVVRESESLSKSEM